MVAYKSKGGRFIFPLLSARLSYLVLCLFPIEGIALCIIIGGNWLFCQGIRHHTIRRFWVIILLRGDLHQVNKNI